MGSLNRIDRPTPESGYDSDFYAWALDQATRLRALEVPGLDTENLAEEVENLGGSQRRKLLHRCIVLLTHLLKWEFQPVRRGESWVSTIGVQRYKVILLLKESPSLRRTVPQVVVDGYEYAVKQASIETNLPASVFPVACPWTPEEILDRDWMPGAMVC